MEKPDRLKRPVFPNRPWIGGKLYDEYSRTTVLHMDAFAFDMGALKYLVIDWREGGFVRVALDAYLIEETGLTPVWDAARVWGLGKPAYWARENNGIMARVHARVIEQARETGARFSRWPRVSVQAHYVHLRETDCEPSGNMYVERADRPDPATSPTMAELHAKPGVIGRKRGRPRKVSILPDIL